MKTDRIRWLIILKSVWLVLGIMVVAVPMFIVQITDVGFSETASHYFLTASIGFFILHITTDALIIRKKKEKQNSFSLGLIIGLALLALSLWQ